MGLFLLVALFVLVTTVRIARAETCTASQTRVIKVGSDANFNTGTNHIYYLPHYSCAEGAYASKVFQCSDDGETMTVNTYTGTCGTSTLESPVTLNSLPADLGGSEKFDCACVTTADYLDYMIYRRKYSDSSCSTLCTGSNGCSAEHTTVYLSGVDVQENGGCVRYEIDGTDNTFDFLYDQDTTCESATFLDDTSVGINGGTASGSCEASGDPSYYLGKTIVQTGMELAPTTGPTPAPGSTAAPTSSPTGCPSSNVATWYTADDVNFDAATVYEVKPVGTCIPDVLDKANGVLAECSEDQQVLDVSHSFSGSDCSGTFNRVKLDISGGPTSFAGKYFDCQCEVAATNEFYVRVENYASSDCSGSTSNIGNYRSGSQFQSQASGSITCDKYVVSADGLTATYYNEANNCGAVDFSSASPADTLSDGGCQNQGSSSQKVLIRTAMTGTFAPTNAPTFAPSVTASPTTGPPSPPTSPTQPPSPVPTQFPTSTANEASQDAITFGVSQDMSGISKSSWNKNSADNEAVFKGATARLLGCSESDISNIAVEDARRRLRAAGEPMSLSWRLLSTDSITISYDVVLAVSSGESSTEVYAAAVKVVVDSTASGCTSSCLAAIIDQVAAEKGISSASVTSASVTPSSSSDVGSAMTIVVPAPTAAPTKDPVTIGGGAIAGMVVGCSVFLGVVGIAAFFMSKATGKDSTSKVIPEGVESETAENGMASEPSSIKPTQVAAPAPAPTPTTTTTTAKVAPVEEEGAGIADSASVKSVKEASAPVGDADEVLDPPSVKGAAPVEDA